jgi:hypothetical protein
VGLQRKDRGRWGERVQLWNLSTGQAPWEVQASSRLPLQTPLQVSFVAQGKFHWWMLYYKRGVHYFKKITWLSLNHTASISAVTLSAEERDTGQSMYSDGGLLHSVLISRLIMLTILLSSPRKSQYFAGDGNCVLNKHPQITLRKISLLWKLRNCINSIWDEDRWVRGLPGTSYLFWSFFPEWIVTFVIISFMLPCQWWGVGRSREGGENDLTSHWFH